MNKRVLFASLLIINTVSCIAMRKDNITILATEPNIAAEISIPFMPNPFRFLNNLYIAYELEIKNPYSEPLLIAELRIFDQNSRIIKIYDEKNLNIKYLNSNNEPIESSQGLDNNNKALIYVWLSFPEDNLPKKLSHTLRILRNKQEILVNKKAISVPNKKPIRLGSPFKEKNIWFNANAPEENSGHRLAVSAVSGPVYSPQRFAIDWISLDENGRAFKGNGTQLSDWHCYGQELVAVADGIITGVKNNMVENNINSRAVVINYDTVLGNYIALRIDDEHLAVYAHLLPGSLKVNIGDKVVKGQVLAKLGNSGNSDAPHLHFHICTGPNPLLSQGQSYVLEAFELLGKSISIESLLTGGNVFSTFTFEKQEAQLQEELPLQNTVINMPGSGS